MAVLLVEDDFALARTYQRVLTGLEVLSSNSVASATAIIASGDRELTGAVVDIALPDGDGFEVLEVFRNRYPLAAALVVTSACRPDYINAAHRLQASYVVKPFCLDNLRRFAAQVQSGGEPDIERRIEALADRCDLSPRERALLGDAVSGVPRSHLAQTLGVSENTIKTQVRSLLLKTGHRRLSDVVWAVHNAEQASA